MLSIFLVTVFGHAFGYRTIHKVKLFKDLDLKLKHEVHYAGLFLFLFLQIFLEKSFFNLIFLLSVVFCLQFCVFFSLLAWKKRLFRRQLPIFLNEITLRMRMGDSFRQSYTLSLSNMEGSFRHFAREIFEFVTFSQQSVWKKSKSSQSFESFLHEIAMEFLQIDKNPSQGLRRLLVLRRRLLMEENFRRRSEQMSRQVQVQFAFLAVLYLAMLVFVVHQFGVSGNEKSLILSIGSYLVGLILIKCLGRRRKWNL